MLSALTLCLAGAPAPGAEIRVEAAGRHRVDVVGLTHDDLARARAAGPGVLVVFTGSQVPAADVPAVLGELRFDAEAVHFEPRYPFVSGLAYTVRFQLPGRPPLLRTFEVEAPQGEGPRVTAVFPTGDTLPENTLRLYVHFSQPMEARGARHVRLLDEAGAEVPDAFVAVEGGLWDPAQTRLTLLLHPGRIKRGVGPGEAAGPPLSKGATYRIVIDPGLRNGRGQVLTAPFERHFRVGPADRTSPRLDALRVEAPDTPAAPLVVALPEPLDAGLLQRLLWVEDTAGRRVPGTIEIESAETLWQFRPARAWEPGAYVLCVHPALEDRAGNRFDRVFDRVVAATSTARDEPEPLRVSFAVSF